jgi:hypothetical protein
MHIRIGAAVECTDGRAGIVDRIVMDPVSREITHLVVRLGWFAPRGVVVPATAATDINEDAVNLSITKSQLEHKPDFHEERFVLASDLNPPTDYPAHTVLWLTMPTQADFNVSETNPYAGDYHPLVIEERENVPDGSAVLRAGMKVRAGDEELGRVSEVLTDEATGKARGLVVNSGKFGARVVPLDQLKEIDEDRVDLSISPEAFAQLPLHQA